MALQETKFLETEWEAFNRRTQRLGFYTVSADGVRCSDRWGKTRARGGACLLVDKRLAFRPASKRVESDSQVVSAWVGEWLVSCFYAPPVPDADAQAQAAQALQDIFETHQINQSVPWICLGDADKVPGDSCIQATLECYRGAVLAQNSPTRWEGNREVDWIATSQTDQVAQPRCLELHFSDHKVVFSEVAMKLRDCMLGSFKQVASWPLPEGMSCSDWRNVLQDVWQELQTPFPSGRSCQEKWDEFMCQLDALYRTATKRVLDLTSGIRGPGSESSSRACGYLDDRSFSASTASSLLSKVAAWADLSLERVGLSESPDKLQLTATSKQGLEALRNAAPDSTKVSESFEALGVCARFKPRSNTAKETSRLDSALRVITVLGNLRLPWARFQQEARCFGTSKVAYGWLSRCATQRDCWKVWSAGPIGT